MARPFVIPIRLPEAMERYDRFDQNQLRLEIERALASLPGQLDARYPQQAEIIGINPYDFAAVGDGVASDQDALVKAVAEAKATGQELVIPPGTFLLGDDLTIDVPVRYAGGTIETNGHTLTLDAPIEAPNIAVGNKALGLDPGGVVRFGASTGQTIDARYFGCHAGQGEPAAVQTAAALNEMFEVFRQTVPQGGVGGNRYKVRLYLPPGEYHIADSIWAGFASAGLFNRVYTLDAYHARLVATAALADRIVFDNTGLQLSNITGLWVGTQDGLDPADLPRIGIYQGRRSTGTGAGISTYRNVWARGEFKLATWVNYASEEVRYYSCAMENLAETGQWAFVNQGWNYYDIESEFVETETGNQSNTQPYLHLCRFQSNWRGSELGGGGVHLIAPANIQFRGGYNNFLDADAMDSPGFLITDTVEGQRASSVMIENMRFHNYWTQAVRIDREGATGGVTDLRFIDNILRIKDGGAAIRMTDGTDIAGLVLRWRRPAVLVTEPPTTPPLALDGSGSNCDVTDADIWAEYGVEVSREFEGTIRVPDADNTVVLGGSVNQVKARVIDSLTLAERTVNVPEYSQVQTLSAPGTTDDLSLNAGTDILRVATGGGDVTITGITGGSPGRRLEIVNGAGANALFLTHEDAGSAAENRIITPDTNTLELSIAAGTRGVSLYYDGLNSQWRIVA